MWLRGFGVPQPFEPESQAEEVVLIEVVASGGAHAVKDPYSPGGEQEEN